MRRRYRRATPPKAKATRKARLSKPMLAKFAALAGELLTLSVTDRVEALKSLLAWYDEHLSTILQMAVLTAEERTAVDRACKARKLGDGTSIEAEAEQAYRTALRLHYKVFGPKISGLLDLETVYARLDAERDQLQEKESARLSRWEAASKVLNENLGDLLGLTWRVRRSSEERVLDGKTVLLNSVLADTLGQQALKGAVLSVLL